MHVETVQLETLALQTDATVGGSAGLRPALGREKTRASTFAKATVDKEAPRHPEASGTGTEPETIDHEAMMPVWIARVGAGDQAAARAMVEWLQPHVLRIVRARRPRRMAEEDLMQEVFMKMFTRLAQYQGDAPFAHWVARIAVTTCTDHWRMQQRRPELRWADLAEWETEFLDRVTEDKNGRRPGDLLATRELVEKLLSRLRAEDRRVIVLFELEQWTIAEICKETGWSFEFAKMRLFRARRKLCRMLATMGGFDGALWGLSAATVPVWKGKAA